MCVCMCGLQLLYWVGAWSLADSHLIDNYWWRNLVYILVAAMFLWYTGAIYAWVGVVPQDLRFLTRIYGDDGFLQGWLHRIETAVEKTKRNERIDLTELD